jgi:hypothetical protein
MSAFLGLALAMTLAGCATQPVRPGAGAGVAAQLTLERFLQASNNRDLEEMARLFGTERGPVWDTGSTFTCFFKKIGSWFDGTPCVKKRDVEIRMDAIAQILRHEDYRIVREETVAGRLSRATRISVDLTVNREQVAGVPFVLVRTGGGQWLVEEIDLQRVMARPRPRGAPR